MLDCCEPLEKVKARGISFGKLVCLAQCAGAKVEAFRTNHSTVDDFRKFVMRCSTSDDCHLISSYNRASLKQVCIASTDIFAIFFVFFVFFGLYLLMDRIRVPVCVCGLSRQKKVNIHS